MLNHWELWELNKVHVQELLDEAARNRQRYQLNSVQPAGAADRFGAAIERFARRFTQVRLVSRHST
jgi:hypothetical protein